MAGRGVKLFCHDTEVKPDYEKLDELFKRKGMIPEGYEEYKREGKMATHSQMLRWTRAVGVHGARQYIITVDFAIDTGKVMALRRAGWTAEMIATDMGLEVERIEEVLSEIRRN